MSDNPFVGRWTYRSFLNDPDLAADSDVNKLLFGDGTLEITAPASEALGGTIGGQGWSLDLHGSIGYGSPRQVRFPGQGIVGGEEWVYDYIGWPVPARPTNPSHMPRAA